MTQNDTDAVLQLVWLYDPQGLKDLVPEWRDLALRTSADVYLTPDWLLIWLKHFMQDRNFACLVLRKNGRLVGLLPFCLDRLWAGPVRLRLARLAGTDPHCIIFRLPVESPVLPAALDHAIEHLSTDMNCDAISFSPLSEHATHHLALKDSVLRHRDLALHSLPDGTHIVFDLPASFQGFLSGLSKKRRSQFGRDVNGLRSVYQMEAHQAETSRTAFCMFETFHNDQWQAVGRGGHFTDWPGSSEFYRDLAAQPCRPHPVHLYEVSGTTGPLATQFALVAADTAHWRLPARSLDPEAERLSAGKVGLLLMIDALIRKGITRIEAGRGDYSYKLSYGGKTVPVWRFVVAPIRRRVRVQILLAWADFVHLAYYRIWFLKIAPILSRRMGRQARPLWRLWIRSRL